MEERKDRDNRISKVLLPALGLLAVSIPAILYCILGTGSWVEVQDQLDGELLTYIMQARNLFHGDVIPEFMNGMGKSSLTPPAPLAVLLFRFLKPFPAFVIFLWGNLLVGFAGTYALLRHVGTGRIPAMICGILFCYMPFYPVYGLSQMGIPLLILGYLRFIDRKGNDGLNLLCILWYGALSSLALVGFVWVCLGFLMTVLIFRRDGGKGVRSLITSVLLTLTYVILNANLLTEMGNGFVSHRTEIKMQAVGFLGRIGDLLLEGGSYSKVYSAVVIVSMGLVLILMKIRGGEAEERKLLRLQWGILGAVVFFAILAAFYESAAGLALRNAVGGPFAYFQADRVYWTFPVAWTLIFGISLELLGRWFQKAKGQEKEKLLPYGIAGAAAVLVLLQGALIFKDSSVNRNVRLLLLPSYQNVTWESFFMEDVFAEIREAIPEEDGSYNVVSLGLYPSIALYNGFSCADGYSNNYKLEYKYRFVAMESKELEKNAVAAAYFYQWGNRCYLVSGEYGFYEMGGKESGMVYSDLSFDVGAMKNLNIRYLFANGAIENAGELGFTLLEGSPYFSDKSYYKVYVYRIE